MGSRSPHEAKRNAGLVSPPHGANPDYAKSGLGLRCLGQRSKSKWRQK